MANQREPGEHGGMQPGPGVHTPEHTMNLLQRLWPQLVAATAAATTVMASRAASRHAEPAAADEGLRCRGCGWFDSSHELQTGLHVTEHDDDEVVAAALPLATWLEVQLADWQPDIRVEAH